MAISGINLIWFNSAYMFVYIEILLVNFWQIYFTKRCGIYAKSNATL